MIDAISSSTHQSVTMKENGEPRLFVQIPIQWPSVRKSVSSTETNRLQDLFINPKDETYPSSSSSSTTRPQMTNRSHSYRHYTSTKTIAAAVSTQKKNRKRRSRVVSTDSNSSSSSSSSFPSTSEEDEQNLIMSDSQQQKFATLPNSQASTMRKILERRHRHARSNSVPDAPATSLHVDTFLPLHLPPPDLCAKSPLLTYSSSWWPTEKGEKEAKSQTFTKQSSDLPMTNAELRRSESLASFISAQSDGSWHGDQGDDDPDGQLARALGKAQEKDNVDSNENDDVSNNYQETNNAKDSTQHGHGPLQVSTYDYDEEDDQDKVPHAQVSKGKETKADDEQDIAKSAGPLMQRLANYMFNLSMFGSDHNDQLSPFESGMSHSQSDGHLQLSSPSSLNAERKAKQIGRSRPSSSIRNRAATIAGDLDLIAHGEVDQEDLDNSSGLWGLWRWIIPDIDSYMNDSVLGNEKDSQAMKRNISVPSLVSGYSLDTVDEDEWEEKQILSKSKVESTPTPSTNFKNLSPPQLCYAESYLRDSGFGLKSFESSAFNEFNVSGEVPAKVLSIRNHLPTSILVRTEDVLGKQDGKPTKHSSSEPSPLWDNRLVEEPYERTWGSMLGLSVY